MRGSQPHPLDAALRRSAFCVGAWCGGLQLGLIYGLSFLWSSTAYTVLWVLACWFCGALLGLHQQPSRFRPAVWLYPLLAPLLLTAAPSLPPQILFLSSLSGGFAAGYWMLGLERHLVQALRWESLGMGAGYLCIGLTAYRGLETMVVPVALLTGLLVWREHTWRSRA